MPITHRKYQRYAKEAISLGGHKVLKSDTWNETRMDFPIDADVYLELDAERVKEAQERGYNAVQGDIRNLPFSNEEFSTVLDLSTIDHVPDYKKAIQQYHRVLKNDGIALIVAWLSKGGQEPTDESWGGKQYWFEAGAFRKTLTKYFEILREQDFPEHINGDKFLFGFFLKKKGDPPYSKWYKKLLFWAKQSLARDQ
jgi:SAM-dependent methyltransferase